VRFGFYQYVLDCDQRELRRDGDIVSVEPQVFDLIRHLIVERHRVVSKDELIQSIWDGRCVSESTLRSRVNAARKAIGDTGDEQKLIRTYARRGLRFVAPVWEPASVGVSSGSDVRPSQSEGRANCRLFDAADRPKTSPYLSGRNRSKADGSFGSKADISR